MDKKDLLKLLKQKSKELQEPEKSYLEEEIRALSTQNEWSKLDSLIDKKLETNKNNSYALYVLGIAPKPDKLEHHYELADMADIDLDFSPDGRDKIKDWLKKKFGEKNCVSIGTYGTLGVKGSVQEISRVYGIKPFEYLTVSKVVSDEDKDLDVDEIKKKYPQIEDFLKAHPEVESVMTKLTGMKKNIGQHAGGFIVSSDNAFENIPIVRANKGYVTGWQESGAIKELEALGWIKVDILGLACVEQIRICVEEINKKHPGAIKGDPYLIPTDDPKVYDLINTLELDNIFQMESKTFREAVAKIKPRSLQDISNISTLVRPGSANVDDYVKAKLNRREPKCLHHIYNHTRGLMIYQEQLMQVLMELGNFTIFEADKVRRLVRKIGKAKTSDESRDSMLKECEKYHQTYLTNATAKIVKDDEWKEKEASEYAEAQWVQLMKQAAYAFNMPHSYAYSLMGYVQAYLKTYYPLEFWTAALNTIDRGLEKHHQSSLGKYINSITMNGIKFNKPDVNKSGVMFDCDNDKIYFALSYIKDVSNGAENILKLRPFNDWDDFLTKATENKLNKRVIRGLIFSGAVDFDDKITDRPYKWLLYLASKKSNKNVREEIAQYQKEMPQLYELIQIEYDYCKYSFTGIDTYIQSNPKLKNIKIISERDKSKKLWVLLGYISDISTKKSKKSNKEYVLITVTDFRDTIQVYAFGKDFRDSILGKFFKGQMIKIVVKNESAWLKLPWESELNGKFPIEIIA